MPTQDFEVSLIEEIYEKNFEKLYKFFYYKVLSKEIAQDLSSETFLTLVEHITQKKQIDNMTNYLYGIGRNVFLKFLKQKYQLNLAAEYDETQFAAYIQDFVISMDQTTTIEDKAKKYIDKLPEKQKLILYMRLIDKMTLEQICQKIGKDMNYVKVTQKRGLHNLRKIAGMYP